MSNDEFALANQFLEQEIFDAALAEFDNILQQKPQSIVALRGVCISQANLGNWMESLNAVINAVGYGNNRLEDLELFIQIVEACGLSSYIEPIEEILKVTLKSILLEGKATVLLNSQLMAKYKMLINHIPDKFNNDVNRLIQDDTLCRLIERACVTNYPLEQLLLIGRGHLLRQAASGIKINNYKPFLSSLVCLNLLNDGLYSCNDEEQVLLDKVTEDSVVKVLLKMCFSDFNQIMALFHAHKSQLMAAGVNNITEDLNFYQQVMSSQEQSQLKDETSKSVQSFYTQNPYPKWKSIIFNPVDLRQFFGFFGHDPGEHYQALVAGCGTGLQVIDMALANPHITITAIDLSPTSLAYARQMAERFLIENIQFKLLDILDIDQLGQKFDYIMCTGVLHHMASPQAGLKALSSVLNDKGLMLLGFYSETARHSLSQYKTDIANFLCVDSSEITPKGISQWRSQLSDKDKKSDWFHTNEFFYLNGLVDALIHPIQFEYQLPQLGQMLEQAQLNFQMMAISNIHKAKYQQALTAVDLYQPDAGEAESLEQWHQLELNNPNFFTGMFNFFATKSTQAKA